MTNTNNNDDDNTITNPFQHLVPSTATVEPDYSSSSSAPAHYYDYYLVLLNEKNNDDINNNNKVRIALSRQSQVHCKRNYLLVGRQASTCDIRMNTHKSLSRQHALLYFLDNLLYVLDLNTKSGTFVNGQRLIPHQPTRLSQGDTLQWGKAPQTFQVEVVIPKNNNNTKEDEHQDTTTTTTTTSTTSTTTPQTNTQPQREETKNANPQITTQPQEQEQQQQQTSTMMIDPSLTGRAKRQAEIAAMMASLDDTPTYTKFVPEEKVVVETTTKVASPKAMMAPKALEKYKLPLEDCTSLAALEKDVRGNNATTTITCIAMDPSGARFAMGSMDATLRLFDFAGLYSSNSSDGGPTPFATIALEEQGSHPIRSLAYSPKGDQLLVATESCQPVLLDREGQQILKFVRGDVYVTDPTKTMGHTARVTDVAFYSMDPQWVFTTSYDGSLRVWNLSKGKLSFQMLTCSHVITIKHLMTGQKTVPTCLATTPSMIAMGTICGSIQIYHYPFVSQLRPQQSTMVGQNKNKNKNKNKNNPVESIVSMIFSPDTTHLAVRTTQRILVYATSSRQKLSTSSKPVLEIPLLSSSSSSSEEDAIMILDNATPTMSFSPNGKTFLVGVTTPNNTIQLQVYTLLAKQQQQHLSDSYQNVAETKKENTSKDDKSKVLPPKPIYTCDVMTSPSSSSSDNTNDAKRQTPPPPQVVGLVWHAKLNQVLVATSKAFQLWYSRAFSQKGVLLTAGAMSSSSSKRSRRRGMEEDLQEMYASRAPPPGSAIRYEEIIAPNALPLFGGEDAKAKKKRKRLLEEEKEQRCQKPQQPSKPIYNTHNTIFAQLVVDQQTKDKKVIASKDPREALAQYSEGKSYISSAYEGNIERILADTTVEQEEEDQLQQRKK